MSSQIEKVPSEIVTLDVNRIKELIPHRDPFLWVDSIKIIEPGKNAIGTKHVKPDEDVFRGHFPGHPIFPGVLIIEAMAQTAGCLVVQSLGPTAENKLVYFMTIDEARFRKPVGPDDMLEFHVSVERSRGPVWKFIGEAKVGDQLHAEASFSAMIMDRE
jgi:3-hydroxyacyl-[acyl-carrier-protein] dehydratase